MRFVELILISLYCFVIILGITSLYTGYKDLTKLGKPIVKIRQSIKGIGNIFVLFMFIWLSYVSISSSLRIRVLSVTALLLMLGIIIFLVDTIVYMIRTPKIYEGGFVHYYAIIPWQNVEDYQWQEYMKGDKVTLVLKGSFRKGIIKYRNRKISLRLTKEKQVQVQKILSEKGITEYCSS